MSLTYTKIPLSEIPQFSRRDLAYITEEEDLRPFYKYPVTLDQFEKVIADKEKEFIDRGLLVKVFEEQYQSFSKQEEVLRNIQQLKEPNSFTVITAHQPSLFTGPLYYIYKILSTIKLSEVLNERFPNNHFVPVFVSGSEDHDFEEVNHATVFGKTIPWENEENGPVGKMSTASLLPAIEKLSSVLGESENAKSILQKIRQAYEGHSTYGAATIYLVHELFKKYGLVIIDMSHPDLKRAAIPIFKEELLEEPSIKYVESSITALNEKGYKAQASPRDINLFYFGKGFRERIVKEADLYKIVNTNIQFTEAELLAELDEHPERFSPNVILRPIYQEKILPNLAYIGGGGEIAYWLERKTQFEHFGINFPMLIRRSSALIIKNGEQKKMDKLGLQISDLFSDSNALVKKFLHDNANNSLDLSTERKTLKTLYEGILSKAKLIDPTLTGPVKAEESKQMKSLEQMEARFIKAEKRKKEQQINQITQLLERLFPNSSLQERKENFLTYYLNYGDDFFDLLKEALNPLEKQFVVYQAS